MFFVMKLPTRRSIMVVYATVFVGDIYWVFSTTIRTVMLIQPKKKEKKKDQ